MLFCGTPQTVQDTQDRRITMQDYMRRMSEEYRNYVQREHEGRMRPHLSATGDQPLHKSKEFAEHAKALMELAYAIYIATKDEKK